MEMEDRRKCSEERPYDRKDLGRWFHPDAHEVGEQEDGWPGGDIVRYECPHCGLTWKEELPQ